MIRLQVTASGNIRVSLSNEDGYLEEVVAAEQADRLLGELHHTIVSAYLTRREHQ